MVKNILISIAIFFAVMKFYNFVTSGYIPPIDANNITGYSEKLNRKLPLEFGNMMVRLDKTKVGAENSLILDFTHLKPSNASKDASFSRTMEYEMRERLREDGITEDLRKNKVVLTYRFRDEDGKKLGAFKISF